MGNCFSADHMFIIFFQFACLVDGKRNSESVDFNLDRLEDIRVTKIIARKSSRSLCN